MKPTKFGGLEMENEREKAIFARAKALGEAEIIQHPAYNKKHPTIKHGKDLAIDENITEFDFEGVKVVTKGLGLFADGTFDQIAMGRTAKAEFDLPTAQKLALAVPQEEAVETLADMAIAFAAEVKLKDQTDMQQHGLSLGM